MRLAILTKNRNRLIPDSKLLYRSMQVKTPSKRVSQLDLKFLDLKFLALRSSATSPPLTQTHTNELVSRLLLQPQNSVECQKSIDETVDITMPHSYANATHEASVLQDRTPEPLDQYLSTDLETIRNKCMVRYEERENQKLKGNRLCSNLEKEHRSKEFGNRQRKIGRDKVDIDAAINSEIQKYEQKIQRIGEENVCIHNEIAKLSLQTEPELKKVKNIKTLKVRGPKLSSTPNLNADELATNVVFDHCVSHAADQVPLKAWSPRQGSSSVEAGKVNKLSRLRRLGANSLNEGSFSSVMKKYERFYEDLVDSQTRQPNEELEGLRKKMMNNNLSKGFESFLLDRKMRVPELFKKLR